MGRTQILTVDEYFAGEIEAHCLFEALRSTVETLGAVQVKATKSQVAFTHRKAFAWAWMPGMYLKGKHAPLVLTIALRRHDLSPRWKEVVEPYPGRFTHHLELYSSEDIDAQVQAWLQEAYQLVKEEDRACG